MSNWVAIVVAVIGSLGSLLAVLQAGSIQNKTALLDKNKVDAEAYQRAQAIYESGIRDLESQVARLKDDLGAAQTENRTLRKRVSQLELIIWDMKMKLRDNGGVLE